MKFTAQEEYGLRCLLTIAAHAPGTLTIPEISHIEGLSVPNTAKLLTQLRRAHFIVSHRGQIGGYCLARPADQILVKDVLGALGGDLFPSAFCERHAGQLDLCAHRSACSLRGLWRRVQDAVDEVLSGVTLRDLLDAVEAGGDWIPLTSMPRRVSMNGTSYPQRALNKTNGGERGSR